MPEAGKITTVVTVDGANYKQGMEQLGQVAVDSSAKRVEAAKTAQTAEEQAAAAAKRNAKMDVDAKKLQEKAAQELAAYQGTAAQESSIRIMAAYNQQQVAIKALATARRIERDGLGGDGQAANAVAVAYERLTAAKMELAAATKVETHAISDRMAASAVVRGLETGNVGIRSVENFLTTIPGSTKVLQAAFSVIGPVAFAAAVYKGGEAFYDMEQKALHARESIAQAFLDQDEKARLVTDDIVIQADKLRDERDILSGHPNNGLATALDEARKRADQLLNSLQSDRKELEAIFKENGIGLLEGFFTGQSATRKQEKELLKDNKQLSKDVGAIDDNYLQAREGVTDPKALKALSDKRNADEQNRYRAELDNTTKEIQRLKQEAADSVTNAVAAGDAGGNSPIIDNDAKIENAQGYAQILRRTLARRKASQEVDDLQPVVAGMKGDKRGTEDGKKADERRLRSDEALLAARKLEYGLTNKQVFEFWEQQKATYRAGSEAYNQIVEKQAAIAVEQAKEAQSKIKQFTDERKRQASEDAIEVPRMLNRNAEDMRKGAVKDAGERGQDYIDSNQLAMEQARNMQREHEVFLTTEAGRSMTRYAAAVQLAESRVAAFRAEQEALQGVLDVRADAAKLDPSKENKAKLAAAQRQLDDLRSQNVQQYAADQVNMYGRATSGLVGFQDALEAIGLKSVDAAAMMKRFTEETLGGFNSELLRMMTTRSTGHQNREALGNYGAGVFRSVAGMGLEKAEGGLLRGLGLSGGKAPKGTKGDPLFVAMATQQAQATALQFGSDGLGGLIQKWTKGGMGSGPSGGGESWLAKAGGLALQALPAFAAGGAIDAGTMAIIGEKGPELFMPKSSGTIVPNSRLMGGGGDTHHHHYDIDARGATDPAAVRYQVMQGIKEAAPHIISATLKAHADRQRRLPSIRRS